MKILKLILLFLLSNIVFSQSPEWISFNQDSTPLPWNNIRDLCFDYEENIWLVFYTQSLVAKEGGLAHFNRQDWLLYQPKNLNFPANEIYKISIDKDNNKWIASQDKGLIKFANDNWSVFDTSNSDIPSNTVWDVKIDGNNIIWVATSNGLASYDGSAWTYYDITYYFLLGELYTKLFIDKNNTKWICTMNKGLIKFDIDKWAVYDTSNSIIRNNYIKDIALDSNNNIWIASFSWPIRMKDDEWTLYDENYNCPVYLVRAIAVEPNGTIWFADSRTGDEWGVASFDGTNWKYLKRSETPLPASPQGIRVDKYGNKWFLYNFTNNMFGLVVYKEGGVVNITDVEDDIKVEQNKVLCYPNPTSGAINLRYRIETAGIINIFLTDILGNQTLLKTEYKFPGDYVETFNLNVSHDNANVYPQGIYNIVLQSGENIYSERVVVCR